jgi:DNA-binding LytR/AlgR family response regulator
MIKIFICDDDNNDITKARQIIYTTAKEQKIHIEVDAYSCAADIIKIFRQKKELADILILDVDMPEMTGLQLARQLRDAGEEIIIIFLSAHEEFVFKAIEYNPFRYVRKLRIHSELPSALQAAFAVINANGDKEITVKTDDGERRILLSEIIYYEVFGRKIAIYLRNGAEVVTPRTVREMGEIIDKQYFIAIHRNCVVNANYIEEFSNSIIVMKDGQKLIVGRTRLKEVKNSLLSFWGDLV